MRTLFTAFLVCWSITLFGDLPEGDYVVVFQGRESPREVARDHGVGIKRGWTNAVHGFSAHLNANQASKLERDTRVQIIEPDLTVTALAQATPTGVRRIGCESNAAWINSASTPIDADIAILDTGIDLTHPDLNVYQQVSFTTNSTANDGHGHGTHCAGIAAARNNSIGVVGVAPGARLWAVKVLDDTGSGSMSGIISGVDYVTQHSSEIEVASMSLGGNGESASLRLAIQNSVSQGIVYVVAAGNSAVDIYGGDRVLGGWDDSFPASYPEVMTVSAMGDSDGVAGGLGASSSYGDDDTMATFSNYSGSVDSTNPVRSPGLAVDVAAPGVNIYSTYKNGTYATLSGTSMACPHVAGVVALYIASNTKPTTAAGVYAVRQAIIDAGRSPYSWGKNFYNPLPFFDRYPEPLAWCGQAITGSMPVVKIVTPPNYAAFNVGAQTLSGTATDADDGTISGSLSWYIGGTLIGSGASSSHTFSTVGDSKVVALVTNSNGNTSSDQAVYTVRAATPTAPTVTITSPTTGSTVANPVSFSGSATDATDGNISSKLIWRETTEGVIGSGPTFAISLIPGAKIATASLTNSAGTVGSASVSFTVSGVTPPATNHPPIVTILYPVAGASFAEGTGVTVSSSASDVEDGDLTSSVRVADNINGEIGTGESILFFPGVGSHTLVASVTDSTNSMAMTTRSFTVYARQTNTPPSIYITAPANNYTVVSNTVVTFSATATDAEDGTIVPSWYNSISGVLGSGSSLSTTLTNIGTNLITASATDSGGLVAQAQVSVIVSNAVVIPNTYPVVLLTVPTNGLTVTTGSTVLYAGSATDAEDGALVVTWVDSIAGLLGTGNTGAYIPSIGTHTLTASGTDSQGATSSKSVLVQVNNTNALPSQLMVALVTDRTSYVNKQKAKITATVTCNGAAVVGATCNFTIRGASGGTQSKTVTTTTGGVASFYVPINKAKLGAGVATVTVNAIKTGYLSGAKSTTFTIL